MRASPSLPEALREFDPLGSTPPILCEPLQRIAWEAWMHFADWNGSDVEELVKGVAAMLASVEAKDDDFQQAFGATEHMESGDIDLLGFEDGILASVYRYFVSSRVAEASLADALMAHALAVAARANAIAHDLADRRTAAPERCEELAGLGMSAEQLLGTAKLSRQGVLYADRKASRQGRVGADSRYSALRQIKERFVEFYRAGEFRSKAEAARRYYQSLPEDDRKTLAPSGGRDGAVRTLRETLQRSGL